MIEPAGCPLERFPGLPVRAPNSLQKSVSMTFVSPQRIQLKGAWMSPKACRRWCVQVVMVAPPFLCRPISTWTNWGAITIPTR